MKFTVKALSNSSNGTGRARVGLLQLGNYPTPIETPSLLLSTRKALLVFIAPDLLPSLLSPDSHLLQVSPLHFLESPTPNAISSIGGLHKMVGLHKYCFVAAPRDSMLCLPACESSNKFGASFETPCSRRLIRPAEYMEMISSLKPNLWASLADEVLKLDQQMKDLAKLLMVEQSLLVFGRGYNYATVLEGALKVKEVALMHTEGILAGEMKHGPLALVDENLPTVVIATHDACFSKQQSIIQQLHARKGCLIVMCSKGEASLVCPGETVRVIEVLQVEDCLQPVVNIIPLQVISEITR